MLWCSGSDSTDSHRVTLGHITVLEVVYLIVESLLHNRARLVVLP